MRKFLFISLLFTSFFFSIQAQNTLQDYIRIAKANSPLIKDNKNQSEATKIEIERLKAAYTQPQVGLDGSYLLAPVLSQDNGKTTFELNPKNAPNKYIGYDYSINNGGLYQGLIGVSQPLFTQSKFKAVAGEAAISQQVNENNIQLTNHEIEKLVTDQYILCQQDYKQMNYLNKILALLHDQKDLVTRLANSGVYKLSDLSLFNIEYQTQTIALNTYQSSYRSNLMDLNILCGLNDTSYQVLPDPGLRLTEEQSGSAFTERYRLDSLSLLAQQQVFDLRYKPQVNAFANAGLSAVNISTLPQRFGFNAGINFTMNLYDGRQKQINQRRTNILLLTAGSYKETFINQNAVRKAKIRTALQSLKDRIELTNTELKEYDKLLDYYKEELLKGQISIINYVNTVKNFISLQKDYTLMETNQQLLINSYNYWNW